MDRVHVYGSSQATYVTIFFSLCDEYYWLLLFSLDDAFYVWIQTIITSPHEHAKKDKDEANKSAVFCRKESHVSSKLAWHKISPKIRML